MIAIIGILVACVGGSESNSPTVETTTTVEPVTTEASTPETTTPVTTDVAVVPTTEAVVEQPTVVVVAK